MTRFRLGELPGALALGAPAAFAAHAVLYRGSHAEGGSLHGALMHVALTAGLGFSILMLMLAWRGTTTSTGSVLAARLGRLLPRFELLLSAAAIWYTVGESLEPHHARPRILAIALCVAAAACLVRALARAIVRGLAAVAIAFAAPQPPPRSPQYARHVVLAGSVPAQNLFARHLFARPPPQLT